MKHFAFLLSILMLSSFSLSGQSFLRTNGKAIINEQGDTVQIRAMGLGGWMLQEGYMLQTSEFARIAKCFIALFHLSVKCNNVK